MDNFKNILIKIPEWWVSLHLPIAFTIGIPILLVIAILIYASRRALLFFSFFAIISTVTLFILLANFCDKFEFFYKLFRN
ncbi:MAG: hypothetical protein Q8L26_06525 [Candidatus Omnitrophota bacterium]|nr:hypothetical protein [Candidatus Omnitrophota bacterium]